MVQHILFPDTVMHTTKQFLLEFRFRSEILLQSPIDSMLVGSNARYNKFWATPLAVYAMRLLMTFSRGIWIYKRIVNFDED